MAMLVCRSVAINGGSNPLSTHSTYPKWGPILQGMEPNQPSTRGFVTHRASKTAPSFRSHGSAGLLLPWDSRRGGVQAFRGAEPRIGLIYSYMGVEPKIGVVNPPKSSICS